MVSNTTTSVTAIAPGKAILLGEHAVNRHQMALAVSVGLYSECTLTLPTTTRAQHYLFKSASLEQHDVTTTRTEILELGANIDKCLSSADYQAIQRIVQHDFFAPTKYVLAVLGSALPPALEIVCRSTVPAASGLGSGGSIFVALAAALARLLKQDETPHRIAEMAVHGDVIAHGGTASGLDTQTSLYGGAIRYTLEKQAEPIAYAAELSLVIGHTGIAASTGTVNTRVRGWLAKQPSRMHYFQEIGLLAQHAETRLRQGDWIGLGHLLNLNQLVLERIGVSCPELETLISAALAAGALGAKLSGSGGGGIMIALVRPETQTDVTDAIRAAGGTPYVVPIGVPGVAIDGIPLVQPAINGPSIQQL